MNYSQAINYVDEIAKFGSQLGLTRVQRLLDLLGNPEKQLKIVHVAGTNGKGSVTALLSSILREGGYRVGVYTSPHFVSFRERYTVNGEPISREDFARDCSRVYETVQADETLAQDPPTQFEVLTAIAFLYFAGRVDLAVFEVGMGGRMDATNVLQPLLSVLTSISLEHTEILGDTLTAIAGEKAGIIKPGVPVVVAPQEEEALQVIRQVAQRQEAPLRLTQEELSWQTREDGLAGQTLQVSGALEGSFSLGLLGEWQGINAAVSLLAALELRRLGFSLSEEALRRGLSQARWPGRFEVISRQPVVILDGAHNPAGAELLAKTLKKFFPQEKILLVLGVLRDKDMNGIVGPLASLADEVITVPMQEKRARPPQEVAEEAARYCSRVRVSDSLAETLQAVRRESGKIICLCGSLYLVGEVKGLLGQEAGQAME